MFLSHFHGRWLIHASFYHWQRYLVKKNKLFIPHIQAYTFVSVTTTENSPHIARFYSSIFDTNTSPRMNNLASLRSGRSMKISIYWIIILRIIQNTTLGSTVGSFRTLLKPVLENAIFFFAFKIAVISISISMIFCRCAHLAEKVLRCQFVNKSSWFSFVYNCAGQMEHVLRFQTFLRSMEISIDRLG